MSPATPWDYEYAHVTSAGGDKSGNEGVVETNSHNTFGFWTLWGS